MAPRVRRHHHRPAQGDGLLAATTTTSASRWTRATPRAVRRVFVDWFDRGLVYRGKRIINWCPRCSTALSDIEVEHEDVDSHLWHLRYPLKEPVGGIDHVVVATTRPETMLGDTCIAVHPDDERYKAIVGATVVLPLMGREIPIVADDYVDPSFGSGAVKVTPAHDPNDFEIGERHDCAKINIMNADATISEEGGVVRRPRPLRGAQARARRPRCGRPARQDRRSRALGRPLLPLPHGHRAVALGPVVRRHEAARRAGDRSGPRRSHHVPPEALGERLLPLDGEHPRLVHLAPAVVGSPHPGLLLRRLRRDGRVDGRPHRRARSAAASTCARTRTSSTRGSRRSCGRSPRSAGPSRRRSSTTSIPPTCSRPPATSSSCGSRAW